MATGGTRITARSVPGSSPTRSAWTRWPSANATSRRVALWTTWLFVRTNPSGVNTKPEPLPGTSLAGRPRRSVRCRTSTLTTAGPTFSAAAVTARKYASSRSSSSGGRASVLSSVCGTTWSASRESVASISPPLSIKRKHRLVPVPPMLMGVIYLTPYGAFGLARRDHGRYRGNRPGHGVCAGPCRSAHRHLRPDGGQRGRHRARPPCHRCRRDRHAVRRVRPVLRGVVCNLCHPRARHTADPREQRWNRALQAAPGAPARRLGRDDGRQRAIAVSGHPRVSEGNARRGNRNHRQHRVPRGKERRRGWDRVFRLQARGPGLLEEPDRKSTRLNSSHMSISYAVFCLKKKNRMAGGS